MVSRSKTRRHTHTQKKHSSNVEEKGANTIIFLKPAVNLPSPLNKNAADTNTKIYVYVCACVCVCEHSCVYVSMCVCCVCYTMRHHVVKQDPAQVSLGTAEGVRALCSSVQRLFPRHLTERCVRASAGTCALLPSQQTGEEDVEGRPAPTKDCTVSDCGDVIGQSAIN